MTAPLSDCTVVCSQRKPLLFEVSHCDWQYDAVEIVANWSFKVV